MDGVCAGFVRRETVRLLPLLFVIVNMMLSGLRFNLPPWAIF